MGWFRTPAMAAKPIAVVFMLLLCSPPIIQSQIRSSPIKTIVVLVMENRSFDHMLGWMKSLNPEIDGVDGSESNLLAANDPNSQRFFFQNQSHYVNPDPGHSFQAIREQIFGSENTSADPPPMNGFAQQAFSMDTTTNMSREVMNGFLPDMVSVYKTLVSEFAAFDSVQGGGPRALSPPNRDLGVDGMISVIAHELVELTSNPLVNAWYAGEDPTHPTEIGDLCEGLYGTVSKAVLNFERMVEQCFLPLGFSLLWATWRYFLGFLEERAQAKP